MYGIRSFGPLVETIYLLCRLRSIAAHRDHFVWRLSVCSSIYLSGSHTFLVVTHNYVSQATHAFLEMLPLCYTITMVPVQAIHVLCFTRSLGDRTTSIELDIPTLTESQVAALEEEVNSCIFRCIPVTPIVYHDKHDPDLKQVKTGRGGLYFNTL